MCSDNGLQKLCNLCKRIKVTLKLMSSGIWVRGRENLSKMWLLLCILRVFSLLTYSQSHGKSSLINMDILLMLIQTYAHKKELHSCIFCTGTRIWLHVWVSRWKIINFYLFLSTSIWYFCCYSCWYLWLYNKRFFYIISILLLFYCVGFFLVYF